MADDSNEPATKGDLSDVETSLRADVTKLDMKIDTITAELVNHMDDIKDAILRAFGMVEENIRKDMTHIDEHRGLEQRVAALEEAVPSSVET